MGIVGDLLDGALSELKYNTANDPEQWAFLT